MNKKERADFLAGLPEGYERDSMKELLETTFGEFKAQVAFLQLPPNKRERFLAWARPRIEFPQMDSWQDDKAKERPG